MIAARKSLGQHFLRDANITDKIVRLCGNLSALNIVEIGPGPGALTRSILAANPLSYTGIEKDERMLPGLHELLSLNGATAPNPTASPPRTCSDGRPPAKYEIIHADALRISLPETVPAPRAIIANLPYNVGTEMLVNWLHDVVGMGHGESGMDVSMGGTEQGEARSEGFGENPHSYKFMTLMFQKEVVDRLVAKPNTKDYGRLSILTQWLCKAEALFDLPPSAFSPPPKVVSTVVKITPRPHPAPCNLHALEKLTGAAFGQRRKMLRQSLKPLGGEALLEKAGITPTLRAENLTVEEFVKLANLLD